MFKKLVKEHSTQQKIDALDKFCMENNIQIEKALNPSQGLVIYDADNNTRVNLIQEGGESSDIFPPTFEYNSILCNEQGNPLRH